MSKIKVVPYSKNWPVLFDKEAASIQECLKDNFIEIHHVGSTSVERLCAKPQIDIIIVAKNIKLAAQQLNDLGYVAKGEMYIPFCQFCKKNLVDYGYNVHIYEKGDAQIDLNLMFRDALRNNEDLKNEYARLKMQLVKQEKLHLKSSGGIKGYNLEKNNFILKVRQATGFDRFYMTYCIHYNEWNNYHRIMKEFLFEPKNLFYKYTDEVLKEDNSYYFVFYKGVKIIGTASIEGNIIRDVTTDREYKEYFLQMQNLLQKWISEH